jgi:hypothetical protein
MLAGAYQVGGKVLCLLIVAPTAEGITEDNFPRTKLFGLSGNFLFNRVPN